MHDDNHIGHFSGEMESDGGNLIKMLKDLVSKLSTTKGRMSEIKYRSINRNNQS